MLSLLKSALSVLLCIPLFRVKWEKLRLLRWMHSTPLHFFFTAVVFCFMDEITCCRSLWGWRREFLKYSFILRMISILFLWWLINCVFFILCSLFLALGFCFFFFNIWWSMVVCLLCSHLLVRVKVGTGSWSVISLQSWESVPTPYFSPHWASWSGFGSVDGAFPFTGIPPGWWMGAGKETGLNNVKLDKTSSVPAWSWAELPSWFIFFFFLSTVEI